MADKRTELCLSIDVRDKFSNCEPKTMSIRGFFSSEDVDAFVKKVWKKYDLVDKNRTDYDWQQTYDVQSPEEALILLKINPDD